MQQPVTVDSHAGQTASKSTATTLAALTTMAEKHNSNYNSGHKGKNILLLQCSSKFVIKLFNVQSFFLFCFFLKGGVWFISFRTLPNQKKKLISSSYFPQY